MPGVLPEDLGSVSSIYTAAHNSFKLQVQNSMPLQASVDNAHTFYRHIHKCKIKKKRAMFCLEGSAPQYGLILFLILSGSCLLTILQSGSTKSPYFCTCSIPAAHLCSGPEPLLPADCVRGFKRERTRADWWALGWALLLYQGLNIFVFFEKGSGYVALLS